MTKKWNLKFNAKNQTYTFSLHNREPKKGFIFRKFFGSCQLNSNSIAIYKNAEQKEIALVREYGWGNTADEPVFMSIDNYNSLVENLGGINDASDLAILLNRLFDCEMTSNEGEIL